MLPRQKVNGEISAAELRVVDEKGENIGVMKKEEALAKAMNAGLDLIEIAPQAVPPVARIMSFDKWRFLRDKEEKKAKLAQKQKELKRVQISARIAENDMAMRAKQAEKFLSGGHKVEIHLRLRGREKANKDWALGKLKGFIETITVPFQVTMEPRQGGRGYIMQITKK